MSNIKKCLVRTYGYFGDIMFAGSLAEKLKESYDIVDYLIGWPQMKQLTENNPFIDNVIVSNPPNVVPNYIVNKHDYDTIYELRPLSFEVPPCIEYQQSIGLSNVSASYNVYTSAEYDDIAFQQIDNLRKLHKKPILAVMNDWQLKTYLFTKEQYEAGIDVPNFGYGGKNRDINYILSELEKYFTLLGVGISGASQQQTIQIPDNAVHSLLFEASILKAVDAFIGTEGGLCNLAAGVGTKTIITGDFVHQLYGWNGVIKKLKEPKLGPKYYFPYGGHITLDPYYTDNEIVEFIKRELL